MLKRFARIAVPALALGALLMAAPPKAKAGVRFGVYVGGPAYSYPVDPYAYQHQSPYPDYYYSSPYPYSYSAPAPVYVAPYNNWEHERHERMEHERHEWREHNEHDRGRDGWERGYRR
jgi:hypothetical protein